MDKTNAAKTTRRALKLCALALSAELLGSESEAVAAGYQAGRHIWMTGADIQTWMRTYPECRTLYTEMDPRDPDLHIGVAFDSLVRGWHDMARARDAATPAN